MTICVCTDCLMMCTIYIYRFCSIKRLIGGLKTAWRYYVRIYYRYLPYFSNAIYNWHSIARATMTSCATNRYNTILARFSRPNVPRVQWVRRRTRSPIGLAVYRTEKEFCPYNNIECNSAYTIFYPYTFRTQHCSSNWVKETRR